MKLLTKAGLQLKQRQRGGVFSNETNGHVRQVPPRTSWGVSGGLNVSLVGRQSRSDKENSLSPSSRREPLEWRSTCFLFFAQTIREENKGSPRGTPFPWDPSDAILLLVNSQSEVRNESWRMKRDGTSRLNLPETKSQYKTTVRAALGWTGLGGFSTPEQ